MPIAPTPQRQFLHRKKGGNLAYLKRDGKGPGVLFLSGFRSDMRGTKAEHLDQYCAERGIAFTRFDYRGHGESEGAFEDGRIGLWLEDALAVIDELTDGPLVLVGSSMGGWLALLAALKRPERVKGILGIASAPDFTEALMWDRFTDKQQKVLARDGSIELPSLYDTGSYRISVDFLEESTEHFLLDKPSIPIHCPVNLLHGINDADVPFEFSMALNEKLESKQVSTLLIPNGDHRLSSEKNLKSIGTSLEKLLALAV